MIRVTFPGLQTTVQDRGRDGYYALGMPPAGALDQRSYELANLLVGNVPGAAALEFVFIGPALEFTTDAVIAVTGASAAPTVDGEQREPWTAFTVRKGQTLSFGPMSRGSRGYIAVRGGIAVPELLGSRSTYQTVGFGGHEGRALRPGDELPIGTAPSHGVRSDGSRRIPSELLPTLGSHAELAVVPGLCHYRFSEDSVASFFAAEFTVSHEANRTGYRLNGPAMEFVPREPPFGAGDDPSNVVNLGYPLGSIQIPSGTEPICLLRDAVTGGGYVTFGTIASVDLDRLAQLKTPDTVSFRSVTLAEAHSMRAAARAELAQISDVLG